MAKRVNWGASAPSPKDIDNWDRSSQFEVYDGPEPPNSLFHFKLKVLKSVPAEGGKLPQLRIGLELVPRKQRPEDKPYKGYFIMDYAPVAPQTGFRYIPFLDAIGVNGTDFLKKTVSDDDGNVLKIGQWVNDGNQMIAASLKDDSDEHGNRRKAVATYAAIKGTSSADVDSDEDDDDEDDAEWDDEETDDEEYDDEDESEEEDEEDEEEADEEWDDDDDEWEDEDE